MLTDSGGKPLLHYQISHRPFPVQTETRSFLMHDMGQLVIWNDIIYFAFYRNTERRSVTVVWCCKKIPFKRTDKIYQYQIDRFITPQQFLNMKKGILNNITFMFPTFDGLY